MRRPTPALFDLRRAPLRLETSRLLGPRRPSRLSHLRLQHSPSDQTDKAVDRVFAVSFLAAEPASFDDQHPLVGEPLPGKKHQSLTYIPRKGFRSPDIEPKLDGRGDLVYVLPTGAGSPEEPKVDLAFRDADGAADSDHVGKETTYRASAATAGCAGRRTAELSCSAARAAAHSFSRIPAGQPLRANRPPAESAEGPGAFPGLQRVVGRLMLL